MGGLKLADKLLLGYLLGHDLQLTHTERGRTLKNVMDLIQPLKTKEIQN